MERAFWQRINAGTARFWSPSWNWTAMLITWHMVGPVLILMTAMQTAWNNWEFWAGHQGRVQVGLSLLAYGLSAAASNRLTRFPATQADKLGTALMTATGAFALTATALVLGRFHYSRTFLLMAFGLTVTWFVLQHLFLGWHRPLRLAVAPGGVAAMVEQLPGMRWRRIQSPSLDEVVGASPDGVVVDLHQQLTPEWIRFLADCSLHQVPTFHAVSVCEVLTGKVSLDHVHEGLLQRLDRASSGRALKRASDLLLVFALLPFVLPLMLLVAIAIKIEDPATRVLFWQVRVGQRGRPFRLVKFRSMRPDSEAAGARFAQGRDHRLTAVGKWIRRTRLDELPQFWNIIRGEMSLIGPRPEQVSFVRQFSEQMPLYQYRHLAKPGITGWAQVNQGYAANLDETRVKLQYDLYYVQRYSLWLDALILLKTIRVVVTGFGAR